MDPQAALDCPRAFHFGGVLTLETTIAEETAERLAGLGHAVEWADMRPTAAVRRSGSTGKPACSQAAPTHARTAARWGSEDGGSSRHSRAVRA